MIFKKSQSTLEYILVAAMFTTVGIGAVMATMQGSFDNYGDEAVEEIADESQSFGDADDYMQDYYQGVLEAEAQTAEDYMAKGFANSYFDRPLEARENFQRAQEIYEAAGDKENARTAQGYVDSIDEKGAIGRKELSDNYYNEVLSKQPQDSQDYMERGFAYDYYGDREAAQADFNIAEKLIKIEQAAALSEAKGN
ncbi:MAG: hypothetical protein PHU64_02270 [Candidatus Omnitrophica bacterium]|nr:hypothetical protein [Candidatus Omnitrophota bacterium]MDD5429902.1 hypothetical protein [Candidatus Omnitrophota bacterium]